jgi:Domain of unknown function (DUF2017)
MARAPFRRRHNAIEASLDLGEAAILTRLCNELSSLFSAPPAAAGEDDADPVLQRLFPRAYLDPTEEKAEAEWQELVHGELMEGRHRAVSAVQGALAGTRPHRGRLELTLTEEEAEAWLSVLNDARLALGTRLDVTEDLDFSGLDPDDPDTAPYAVYWWLGLLEEHLVEVLAG